MVNEQCVDVFVTRKLFLVNLISGNRLRITFRRTPHGKYVQARTLSLLLTEK